ncbi:MAG: trypsin-like peptidase domain-containing protein, partial [Lachnospiraceae bacterium]|nr:trypsin-like peptidase domain-containing protein [Lachnospiraceae bacterium]
MDNNDKDFNYVEQKIKPKNRKKVKKVIAIIALTIVVAVLFGFLSRLVFVASEGAVNRILGITPTPTPTPVESTNNRSQVTLGSTSTPTPSPSPTLPPTPTVIPVVLDPTIEPSPTPTEIPPETPTPDPGVTAAPTEASEADPIADYLKMISQMRAIANKAGESLVRVYAVTSGVNWMDESIETRTERTGILVADNGVELLILAEYNAFASADRIEIEFRDGAVAEGSIYMADPDSGLAVIEVELTDISASTIATCKYVSLGDSDNVCEGEPVIALGRPNGYYGAVEFGFVSHTGLTRYFIDGVHFGFTTDIVSGSSSDGMVIDLEGKLV